MKRLAAPAKPRAQFEELFRTMFKKICNEPLVQFMGSEDEFRAVARKVPPAILAAHQKDDQVFLDALIKQWNTKKPPPPRDMVAARMTMLLLTSLNREFLGTRLFPHAVDAAVSSLADCFYAPARGRK